MTVKFLWYFFRKEEFGNISYGEREDVREKFKVGDKVVCMVEDFYTSWNCDKGKVYIVDILLGSDLFFAQNDNYISHVKNFISLKEYRKQKINKICLK